MQNMDIESIIQQLQLAEKEALKLEPDEEKRYSWTHEVTEYGSHFIENIYHLPAYVAKDNSAKLIEAGAISEKGISISESLQIIKNYIDTPGLNPASGGHIGYIPGGGLFPSALGDFLADITNRYAGLFFGSPGAVRLENLLLRWLIEIFGFPAGAAGNLASGGSIANLTAIVTARDAKQIKAKTIPDQVIYLTSQVHHCIDKAIRIAGLNEAQKHWVPLDEHFRMDIDALEAMMKEDLAAGLHPFLVVASAGTTDTGAIDPLERAANIAHEHGAWFHVDAAYGGFFILSEFAGKKLKGIELADSTVVDPHKGLFLPYGTGAVLVREARYLHQSNQYQANYMQDALRNDELSPAELSPELTKHFRGLRMWLPLKLFGLQPFRAALDEKLLLAQYFYGKINELKGFETGPFPDLSVMIFRYIPKASDPNTFNRDLVKSIQEDGRVFLSSTTINGIIWIRLAVLSFRTHKAIIDNLLEIIIEKVAKLENL